VAKAFGAGADFVMLGGMLAGHAEGGGDDVVIDGNHFRQFYGMSSDVAMEKYSGGVAEYRASEGKSTHVPYREQSKTLFSKSCVEFALLALMSVCSYRNPLTSRKCVTIWPGAKSLKEISKRTTFIRVTAQLQRNFSRQPQSPTAAR